MTEKMTHIKKSLYEAFQADHAVLGRSLYDLRLLIADENPTEIRKLANEIIQTSGAHIAFEEFEFYPALKSHLSEAEISAMYLEHAEGLQLLEELSVIDDSAFESVDFLKETFSSLDILDHHIADCGNLFGAMGGLTEAEYTHLVEKLTYWRELAPSWSDVFNLSQNQKGTS